jgi:hypothetical protein
VVDFMTITAPPDPQATYHYARYGLFGKRDSNATAPSCSYGGCGTTCMTQGEFCCNPGGKFCLVLQLSLKDSDVWTGTLAIEPQCESISIVDRYLLRPDKGSVITEPASQVYEVPLG